MNTTDLLAALNLPASALVERRVPKKLLLESGAPTAADKRHINGGIEELFWIAALKPTTIGIPEYRDTEREYLEIAVLRLTLRAGAKAARLVELVHRAIPYPVLLLTEHAGFISISAAKKRWSHGEAGKTVLEGDVTTAEWEFGGDRRHLVKLREALPLERQPHGTLYALYQGWIDTLHSFLAARLTGEFKPAAGPEQSVARRDALLECARLETEITRLRAAAKKEKQMARQVDLNRELKRIEAAYASARARL